MAVARAEEALRKLDIGYRKGVVMVNITPLYVSGPRVRHAVGWERA